MVALAVSAWVAQLAALQILGMAMQCASVQIKSPMNRSACSCVQCSTSLLFGSHFQSHVQIHRDTCR